MRKAAHSIFAFLMILAIAIPALFYVYFSIELQLIRHHMEEQLEQQQLQTLSIKKAAFKWYKKGKEIEVGNRLFDVKEIREEGDILLVKGLYDDQEKKVKAEIALLSKEKNKQTHLAHQLMNNFMTGQIFFEETATIFININITSPYTLITQTQLNPSPFQSIPLPPPRACPPPLS
jgi:hypothetical protein